MTQTLTAAEARKLLAKPKRGRPEQALQIAVAQFLARALRPPVWWSSIDHGAGKMTPASAGLRKARGVKPGLPDILVIAPKGKHTRVVGIELKSPTGQPTKSQLEVLGAFNDAQAIWFWCTSLEAVVQSLKDCDIPLHARLP